MTAVNWYDILQADTEASIQFTCSGDETNT